MRSVTFTLTQDTDSSSAPATITITEQLDGTLSFEISNVDDGDNLIGDLRGLFFDVADDSLLGSLDFTGDDVTGSEQDGSVDDLGPGANVNGVPDSPYEVGVEFGTQGAAENDLQTTSFTLSSSLRGLTLDDISLESIAVRQTSVGDADGDREGSDKLYGDTPYAVNAVDDVVNVDEDTTETGNVFTNDIDLDAGDADEDGIADGLTVVAVDGDAVNVGQAVAVGDAGSGVSITVNADGSYAVDAEDADYLAEGETFSDTIIYAVDDGNGGSDSATITVNVTGVNDGPQITGGDTAGAVTELPDGDAGENVAILSDEGTLDFADVDLSDTHSLSVAPEANDYLGTFQAFFNGDSTGTGQGTIGWTFDVSDALLDGLDEGEQLIQSYDVTVDDGHGGTATETVAITLTGSADGGIEPPRPWEGQDNFGVELNKKGVAQAISNVVLYLQDGDDIIKAKIDNWDGKTTDLDDIDLGNFLDAYFADAELLAVSIKSGNNHNADLGPGEGQLYLLDGDPDIDYQAGGAAPEPLTHEILSAHADVTFHYDMSLFG